ncbi:MAG: AEC family transporter [Clostridia bacterium]|nr:AEC family transporter [Clostridia bacterium]
MFSTFMYAFEAVVPLVLIIFLGYFFKRIGLFTEEFLSKGYAFVFHFALPCLLFCNVYTIEAFSDIDFRTVLYALLMITALFFVGSAIALICLPDKRQRGVVVQCFFRSNCAILGVSLTEALGGAPALQCVSVLAAFSIPLFNVLAVVSLTAFCGDENGKKGLRAINWKKIVHKVVTNPLIIGVVLGGVCLGIRHFIPVNEAGEKVFLFSRDLSVLYRVIENVSKIASPFMLLILGGQFTFTAVKTLRKQIIIGTLGRILLAPCLALGVGYLLSRLGWITLGAPEYASFIALFASPVAVSSAIMAREMGNDDALAGQLVVWTSVGSVFTIFLFAMGFRMLGLL